MTITAPVNLAFRLMTLGLGLLGGMVVRRRLSA